jgi:hypothetical protein
MTNTGHQINSADARRRQIRVMQVLFAGAAAAATLALFSAGPSDPRTAVASGSVRLADEVTDQPAPAPASSGRQLPQAAPIGSGAAGSFIAVDEGVNDQGQTSGDIFTQNAQDQSTASGAGTS